MGSGRIKKLEELWKANGVGKTLRKIIYLNLVKNTKSVMTIKRPDLNIIITNNQI